MGSAPLGPPHRLLPSCPQQLTERVRAALARCLSPPITAAASPPPIWKRRLRSRSRGGREGPCHHSSTCRRSGFEEIQALAQTPPLYLLGRSMGTRKPPPPSPHPQEGMVLLGQGCDFYCFLFLVRQKRMVSEQRGNQEGVRIGRTY